MHFAFMIAFSLRRRNSIVSYATTKIQPKIHISQIYNLHMISAVSCTMFSLTLPSQDIPAIVMPKTHVTIKTHKTTCNMRQSTENKIMQNTMYIKTHRTSPNAIFKQTHRAKARRKEWKIQMSLLTSGVFKPTVLQMRSCQR